MTEQRLRRWLREVRQGRRPIGAVVASLRHFPQSDLGFAKLDTHRRLRRGLPEVVFCQGKRVAQLVQIVGRLHTHGETILLTRLEPEAAEQLLPHCAFLEYDPMARMGYWVPQRLRRRGLVPVLSGGTADLPVAEEAARTLEVFGSRAVRVYDVGVAGLHRLLGHLPALERARALVVVAGMEGALASVVAGLVRCPVVAVPTSVGYGASFAGIGPLLTMLNSCVPGIGVVNIDNGFGAGYLAHLINCGPSLG
ncbi:MAG: nickel pincer cofactor biosynthesis protein LarB [Candidatus Omnitrophica bacterium]|nr:nickel pincer cofactor biosynthesis protein LarB [Candidatus Omnitrophota bacterium]